MEDTDEAVGEGSEGSVVGVAGGAVLVDSNPPGPTKLAPSALARSIKPRAKSSSVAVTLRQSSSC